MKNWFFKNYYNILNLEPGATKEEIESAFKSYLNMIDGESEFGPIMDNEEKERILKMLSEAYEILIDEKSRFFYDAYLVWKKEAFVKIEEKKEEINEINGKEISGKFLREVREKRKMSQKELSLRACITLKIINAIEEENTNLLPPPPYLKGILKEYARALSLPEELVIEEYLKRINEKKKS
jgi:DnaJ-class molecular chaperone